jgi:prevent-host-death family protein
MFTFTLRHNGPHRTKEADIFWQFVEAQNRFSELMNEALANGPQRVTKGDQTVIVLSESEYDQLRGNHPNFVEFLLNGPDFHDLDLAWDMSSMRDIKL